MKTKHEKIVDIIATYFKKWNGKGFDKPTPLEKQGFEACAEAIEQLEPEREIIRSCEGCIYNNVDDSLCQDCGPDYKLRDTSPQQPSEGEIEELWDRFSFTTEDEEEDFTVMLMTKPQFKLAIKELLNR